MMRSWRYVLGVWLVVGWATCGWCDWQGPLREFVSLPVKGAKAKGFLLTVTLDDYRLFGDIPAEIEVAATGTSFNADRELTIRISPVGNRSQPPGRDCVYEIPMRLPQGQRVAEKTVYLPKWSVGGECEVTVWEDRRSLDGYQMRVPSASAHAVDADSCWWESCDQRFGWITNDETDQPDARLFFAMVAPDLMLINDFKKASSGFAAGSVWRQFRARPRDTLPTDWRGFDVADAWVIEADTLLAIAKDQPQQTEALKNYLRCGGVLWVLGNVADDELRRLFDLPQSDANSSAKLIEQAVYLGNTPLVLSDLATMTFQSFTDSRNYIREFAAAQRNSPLNRTPSGLHPAEIQLNENLSWLEEQQQFAQFPRLVAKDFAVHRLALGQIVVSKSAKSIPGTPQMWRTMAALSSGEMSESKKRAVDPCFGDRRFWDWVIPGVAQPPVYTFIGLLTVFVIVVGPIAYRKFTKLGRGYLMMFVAPLLALVTTLVMFAYGLVADGLATRARIREVTWIGDYSGTAARYCRETYFSGIRPAGGMQIPANAVILPYQLPTVDSWYGARELEHSQVGTIRIQDDTMRLDSGFLPSRQQKQWVTYRPVANVGGVSWSSDKDGNVETLTSRLKFELRDGVACNADGKEFAFEVLPAGGTVRVRALSDSESNERLSEMYGLQRPIAPAAISSSRRVGERTIDLIANLTSGSTRYQPNNNRGTQLDSTIEEWLRIKLQIESSIPPNHFIAVADITEDCIAVPATELVESVHYVIGVVK